MYLFSTILELKSRLLQNYIQNVHSCLQYSPKFSNRTLPSFHVWCCHDICLPSCGKINVNNSMEMIRLMLKAMSIMIHRIAMEYIVLLMVSVIIHLGPFTCLIKLRKLCFSFLLQMMK